MIIFKKLTYSNFLSVGSNEISIDFNDVRSTLIIGHNGSGKSLMLDALSFSLFGKPHRAINKPQLINSINAKKCKTEVEFSIGSKDYKIIRGLKPNIFEIYVDGELINQESHTRDYQKLLEKNILKLNHKSFHQVVVLGSSNFVPFMKLPASHRREVIEDILDIGIFSKMNTLLKEDVSKLKDQLKDTEYNITLNKEKIRMQNKHIDSLESISEDNISKLKEEIKEIDDQVVVLTESSNEMTETYKAEYQETCKLRDKCELVSKKLSSYENQILNNIKKIKDDSSFYQTNDTCPTCRQDLSEDIKKDNINSNTEKLEKLEGGYSDLKESIKENVDSSDKVRIKLNELFEINNQLSTNQMLVKNFEARKKSLEDQHSKAYNNDDLVKAKGELSVMRDEQNSLSVVRDEQSEEKQLGDIVSELLKDSGIKTKIIRQYLPLMNQVINKYLNLLEFHVSFELDESFNETIRSRHRDVFSYSSFSEGEKARINLALIFAWRHIASLKNSANTNLLILDEVFDGSLDTSGVESLTKIMNTLNEDTSVFVISHNQEVIDSKFDRKIEFENRMNFTRIKSIS